jgi:hypothetical protein
MVNRMQALVLGFFLLAWASLLAILVFAPEVYAQILRAPGADARIAGVGFWTALTSFLVLLTVGVLRRWRWVFWLTLVAFLAGGLRIPYVVAQLSGLVSVEGPPWYIVLQGALGVLQVAIGLCMLAGYRRLGIWGWPTTASPSNREVRRTP